MNDEHAPAKVDYSRLLNLKSMNNWTLEVQQTASDDGKTFEGALASVQTHLRSQHIEGDNSRSAKRRARKVEKHLRRMAKAAQAISQSAEALRTTYADHVAEVAALPGQRQEKAARRAQRRGAAAEITARSLRTTAARATPREQETGSESDGQVPPATEPLRSVNELFDRARGA
ncbi:hypothetical protein [Streptomyces mayteni]